jgi:hypothetical protein
METWGGKKSTADETSYHIETHGTARNQFAFERGGASLEIASVLACPAAAW